jgi:anti-anti-sigma factor
MPITITPTGAAHVVLADDPAFASTLDDLDARDDLPHLTVLDLAKVTFVNSTHLARLLRMRRLAIEADRRVVLCNVSKDVLGILEATNLTKIFEIYEDASSISPPTSETDGTRPGARV